MGIADGAYCIHNSDATFNSQNKSFFSKPNFKIDFISANSNYERTLDLLDPSGRQLGIKRKWIRVLIKNTGGADANNCHVELNVPESALNAGKRHPSDTQNLCWANQNTNYTFLGKKVDKKYIELVFADSNFHQLRLLGGLDLYAMSSTCELVNSVGNMPPQHAFGIGEFEIEIVVSGNGVSKTKKIILHVDEVFDRTTVKLHETRKQKLMRILRKISTLKHCSIHQTTD